MALEKVRLDGAGIYSDVGLTSKKRAMMVLTAACLDKVSPIDFVLLNSR